MIIKVGPELNLDGKRKIGSKIKSSISIGY
jgi:hypothetical protein